MKPLLLLPSFCFVSRITLIINGVRGMGSIENTQNGIYLRKVIKASEAIEVNFIDCTIFFNSEIIKT